MNEDSQVIKAHVPLAQRIGWGMGGLSNYITMQIFFALALPIYQIAFKVDPIKLGIAMAIPRFLDAVTDPLMGYLSDRTRSRWGRRRPYMVAGAALTAVLLPLLWIPPAGGEMVKLVYFTLISCLFSIGVAMHVVPYTALGYELTDDYDERTRVLAWRMYLGLLGVLSMPWVYKATLLLGAYINGNTPGAPLPEVTGAPWVAAGLGLVALVTGLSPVWACRENPAHQSVAAQKISLFDAFRHTLKNTPFVVLMLVNAVIRVGIASIDIVVLYINIYYVCGSKEMAATVGALAGTMIGVLSYISLPLFTWLSVKLGKRTAMIIGLSMGVIGYGMAWYTLNPRWPYAQIISSVFANFGLNGCWLLMSSMVADVCDEDELSTGMRREGFYGAVSCFVEKISFTFASILSGILLRLSGYVPSMADAGVPVDVAIRMKGMLVSIQSVSLLIAIACCVYYPLNRARAIEVRRQLDARRNSRLSALN